MSAEHRWRALVVDDEPPARALVSSLIERSSVLSLVGECEDGAAAVKAIRALKPDVVFLDIQMPGGSGFDVIEEVGVEEMPLVVFVTAYDEHGIRAFRAHAFDYLLKPLDAEQFEATVARVSERLQTDTVATDRLALLLATIERERTGDERLTIWEDQRAFIVRTADVLRADVDGNYVRVVTANAQHTMRETLSGLESRLPSSQFVRLNRSVLVNIDHIREIQPYFHGDFAVILRDGSTVLSGRTYRERLRKRWN